MIRSLLLFSASFFSLPCFATISVQITSSLPSPQLVATPIPFTVSATDTDAGTLDYQFSVSMGGGFQVVQDFSTANTLTWAPSDREGRMAMEVTARNTTTGSVATAQTSLLIQPRVTGTNPVASATAHPLVALYSAPACPAGSSMKVIFQSSQTPTKACDGRTTMNFYVGGLKQATAYIFQHVLISTTQMTYGPRVPFTTGTIPSYFLFPQISIPTPATTPTTQSVLLVVSFGVVGNAAGLPYMPVAYDLSGNVIWYYPGSFSADQVGAYFLRPLEGGTFLLHLNDPTNAPYSQSQIWREVDLAGNTIRQTTVTRVNEQIAAVGYLGCTAFSHDSIRLPSGHTLIICNQERIYPAGTQGSTAPVNIAGSGVVDLDENLQLSWYWSAYDHLDVNRRAILNEKGFAGNPFSPLILTKVANDWTHCNSLNYTQSNGDVLLSIRHQDWVAKLNYANGTGDGTVIWELGQDGDFSIVSTDPYPWFTHQHDVEFELGGTQLLTLFDNGNTRVAQNPGVVENSRGMALNIDETNMIATPIVSQDLGSYSNAAGSAELLDNGDYHFDNALLGPLANQSSQITEYDPIAGTTSGTLNFLFVDHTYSYRAYRMVSLYQQD